MNDKISLKEMIVLGVCILLFGLMTNNTLQSTSIGILIIILSPIVVPLLNRDRENKRNEILYNKTKEDNEIEENKESDELNNHKDNNKLYNNKNNNTENININNIDNSNKINTPHQNNQNFYTPNSYKKPVISLLKNISGNRVMSPDKILEVTKNIEAMFNEYKVNGKVVEVHVGPNFTQYEIEMPKNTKLDKIMNMRKDLLFASGDDNAIFDIPIKGKSTIGITVKNLKQTKVNFKDLLEELIKNKEFKNNLSFPLGRDSVLGTSQFTTLQNENSFLITGTIGTGKSIFLNNMLMTFLYTKTPEELKLILIDPKKVEFINYNDIPHLMVPVVTDLKKSFSVLQKILVEIDDRCESFKNSKTKNIQSYNEYVEKELKKNPNCGLNKMPYILIVIDELSDLIFYGKKEMIEFINKISSMSRMTGIYLIASTNQPYAVEKELMEVLHTTISFSLTESMYATKVGMLDANKLLGPGEMIYKSVNNNEAKRIQSPYISDEEIVNVLNYTKENNEKPKTLNTQEKPNNDNNQKDVLYDEILNYAIRMGQISASLIQRKYSIGYNRAARIMDQFEEQGIVGPAKGSKPREVLIKLERRNDNEQLYM